MSLLVAAGVLAAIVAGCGTTPEPTEPPPTQTPWIIIVTATSAPEEEARLQPTQTPWIIVATPTAVRPQATRPQASPTATTRATQGATTPTRRPPAATNTPAAGELKYPPPALLDPPTEQPVSWKSTVLLKWSSVGELARDEYYHLHLERRPQTTGETWYGDYVYTKETQYLAAGAFLAPFHPSAEHGKGVVYWWVRVVRKTGEDQGGKPIGVDIGGISEVRTLVLDPKPAGE